MNELTVTTLKAWEQKGQAFALVDVREAFERAAFNIGGQHIPLGELMSRRDELEPGLPVVVYCEKGIRSAIAIQRLEAAGFTELYNLQGGMKAYRAAKETAV